MLLYFMLALDLSTTGDESDKVSCCETSPASKVTTGIPHGSFLGPLLLWGLDR